MKNVMNVSKNGEGVMIIQLPSGEIKVILYAHGNVNIFLSGDFTDELGGNNINEVASNIEDLAKLIDNEIFIVENFADNS